MPRWRAVRRARGPSRARSDARASRARASRPTARSRRCERRVARRVLASTPSRVATNRARAGALTRARVYRDRGTTIAHSSAFERHQRFHRARDAGGEKDTGPFRYFSLRIDETRWLSV